jgi:hypothetical protein
MPSRRYLQPSSAGQLSLIYIEGEKIFCLQFQCRSDMQYIESSVTFP